MRGVALALFATSTGAVELKSPPEVPEVLEFEQYIELYGKPYTKSSLDYDARASAFSENAAFIERHNAEADAGLHTYRVGVNQHSDLTREEFSAQLLGGYKASAQPRTVTTLDTAASPASIDWRDKGAVTPVKNQGSCGSCWAFSTTGSIEGAYQIATGALRVLSEQQLVDCSVAEGNKGCQGGAMEQGFEYVAKNGGIDSEDDYPYSGMEFACWSNATSRVMAKIENYTSVTPNEEAQLEAAVALGPVSVAIEADQPGFQSYKSGVFSGPCGTTLDHGVLVVGYTSDYWIVKNSWDVTWGDQGYILMKRGVNASGLCGIAMDASYPVVAKASPVPVPPRTPGQPPSANLPCNCTASCESMCTQFDLVCCGDGNDCNCSSLDSCPKCDPTKPGDDEPIPSFMQVDTGRGRDVNTGLDFKRRRQALPSATTTPGAGPGPGAGAPAAAAAARVVAEAARRGSEVS